MPSAWLRRWILTACVAFFAFRHIAAAERRPASRAGAPSRRQAQAGKQKQGKRQPRVYVYECEGLHCDVFDPVPHTRLERELYEQLLRSPSRVRNLEDADAAYFPVNMVSWYYNNYDGRVLDTYASYKARAAQLEEAWAKWSERLPPPEARARVPHFLIWPYVFYNVNISFVPRDIFVLAYEDVGVVGAPAHASYENGCANRCVVIPYLSRSVIDPARYEQYKSRTLVSFVGSVTRSSATRSFRSRIVSYLRESLPSSDFIFKSPDGGLSSVDEHGGELVPENVNHSLVFKMSKLCLQLPGDTVTRKGFYDAIRHGCSPVVLASSLKVYQRLLGGALPIREAVVTLPDELATPGVPLDGVVSKLRSAALSESEARKRLQAISRIQPFLSYGPHEGRPLSLPFATAIEYLVGRARRSAHANAASSLGAVGVVKDRKASTRNAKFHAAPSSGTTSLGLLQARKAFLFRQNCTAAELADGTSCRIEGACYIPRTGRWFSNNEAPITVLLRPRWEDKYKNKSQITLNPVSAASADEARLLSKSLAIFVPGITVLTRRYAVGNFGHAMLENVFPLFKMLFDLDMAPSGVDRIVLDDDCDDATDHELLFGYPNNGRNCVDYMRFLVNMLLPNVALHEKDFFAHGRPVCFETLALGVGHKSSLVSQPPAVRDSAQEAMTSAQARRAIERYIETRPWKPPTEPSPRFLIHEKALGNRHGASITNAENLCSELTKQGASCHVFSLDKLPSMETQVKLVHDADVFVSDPGSSQYYSIFLRPGARHVTFEKCLVPDGTLRKVCSERGKFDLADNLKGIERAHGKISCAAVLPEVLESFRHVNRTCLQARPDLIRSMSYHNCAPSTEWSKAWFSQEQHSHGLNIELPPRLLLAEI